MSTQLDPEKIIGGQYRLTRSLGSGGMGSIFYGVHILTDQPVAVKLLHPTLCNDPVVRSRFLSEARTLARLEHQNIVQWKNSIEENGRLYLIMQFVDGENVESRLEAQTALPLNEAIPIVLQALSGLAYVHSKNIVHRDIKPSNILINAEGEVKIADFGIAKFAGMPRHTQTGMTIGTYQYMSPEQVLGKELDARSDIYSMGITLFEMVTGQTPFDGETEFDICRQHLEQKLPSIKRYNPSLPGRLNKILRKATSKRACDRYQTAVEFMLALAQAFQEHITEIPPPWGLMGQFSPKPYGCIKKTFWILIWLTFLCLGSYYIYIYMLDPPTPAPEHKRHSIRPSKRTPAESKPSPSPSPSPAQRRAPVPRQGTGSQALPHTPVVPSPQLLSNLASIEDTFATNQLGWPVGRRKGTVLQWRKNSYHVKTDSQGNHQVSVCPKKLNEYQTPLSVELEAQVRKADKTGHAIFGVNLFSNLPSSHASGYYIAINPTHQIFTLTRLGPKGWHHMLSKQPEKRWRSAKALRQKGRNLLYVNVQKGQIVIRINTQTVATVPALQYRKGRVCLFVQQGGAHIEFTRFRLKQAK